MTDLATSVEQSCAQLDARLDRLRRDGALLVGYVGLDVPAELIEAAGCVPVRLQADVLHPAAGAESFGTDGHPVLRSLIAQLLAGRYRHIDHLVIGTTPRHLAALHTFLRQMRELEPAFARYRTAIVDLTHVGRASTEHHNEQVVSQLRDTLQQWSGQSLTDAGMRHAIESANDTRRLLQRIEQRRIDDTSLSGATSLSMHACAATGNRAANNELLRGWLDAPTAAAPRSPPRVMYSGTATDTPDIYRLIEAQGMRIVADDQDAGSRAIGATIDTRAAPLAALAQAYARRAPAAAGFASNARREWFLEQAARCQCQGVIFHAAAYDHPSGWEYPALAAALDAIGIAHARLDPYTYRDISRTMAPLRELSQRLGAPAGTAA